MNPAPRGLRGRGSEPARPHTCGPLRPGYDVLPQLPQRALSRHLLIAGQALRQLDLRRERQPRNHDEDPETTHSALPPQPSDPSRLRDTTANVTLRRHSTAKRQTSRAMPTHAAAPQWPGDATACSEDGKLTSGWGNSNS